MTAEPCSGGAPDPQGAAAESDGALRENISRELFVLASEG